MAFVLNEWEIEEAARRNVTGARPLSRFVDMVNRNSDGWAHWRSASNAATQLQNLVKSQVRPLDRVPRDVTAKDINKALAPMKALCTRKGLPTDWLEGIV